MSLSFRHTAQMAAVIIIPVWWGKDIDLQGGRPWAGFQNAGGTTGSCLTEKSQERFPDSKVKEVRLRRWLGEVGVIKQARSGALELRVKQFSEEAD